MTSIEWLIDKIKLAKNKDGIYCIPFLYNFEIDKAKEMHKAEHEETFKQSRMAKIFEKDMPPVYENFEQYYNETFGG